MCLALSSTGDAIGSKTYVVLSLTEEDRQSKNTLLSTVPGSIKGFEENESPVKGREERRRW